MRYFVTIEGRTFEVTLVDGKITVDGEPFDATISAVPDTPVRRLSVGNRVHALHVRRGEEAGVWDLQLDGERFGAQVVNERTQAIRAMTGRAGAAAGPKPVKAPMPGLIVRIDVAVGDHVRAGQGVLAIEAMKMENELKADAAGVVSRILVEPGQAVEKGTMLIEFTEAA